jgi:hypothetical protein
MGFKKNSFITTPDLVDRFCAKKCINKNICMPLVAKLINNIEVLGPQMRCLVVMGNDIPGEDVTCPILHRSYEPRDVSEVCGLFSGCTFGDYQTTEFVEPKDIANI